MAPSILHGGSYVPGEDNDTSASKKHGGGYLPGQPSDPTEQVQSTGYQQIKRKEVPAQETPGFATAVHERGGKEDNPLLGDDLEKGVVQSTTFELFDEDKSTEESRSHEPTSKLRGMLHYATDGRTKFSLSGSPHFYQNASHGWDKKIEPGQKRDKYRYRDSMGSSEGGMHRAVGCSYDWRTGTLHRETVLRMEMIVAEKMDVIPRARISMWSRDRHEHLKAQAQAEAAKQQ